MVSGRPHLNRFDRLASRHVSVESNRSKTVVSRTSGCWTSLHVYLLLLLTAVVIVVILVVVVVVVVVVLVVLVAVVVVVKVVVVVVVVRNGNLHQYVIQIHRLPQQRVAYKTMKRRKGNRTSSTTVIAIPLTAKTVRMTIVRTLMTNSSDQSI